MSQQMRVLQCFGCALYQVDIVKKIALWQCKVCFLKQAVFKEHFRGTGAECRTKVQELNSARQANDERGKSDAMHLYAKVSKESTQLAAISPPPATQLVVAKSPKREGSSKWARYVDTQMVAARPQLTIPNSSCNSAKRRQTAPSKRAAPSAEPTAAASKKSSKWQNYL